MELKIKILSSKAKVFLVLQFFVVHIYVQSLVECSKAYDYPCAPWILPFYFSSSTVILINMFMVIYYFSDVPYMQYYNMYRIIRYDRMQYAILNIKTIVIESVIYMITNFVFCIICLAGYIDYTISWGKLLYTIATTNETKNIDIFMDISYDTISKFSALELTVQMILLGSLIVSFIGLIMYLVSLLFSRTIAIVFVLGMVAMGYVTLEAVPIIGKTFSAISPVSWLYITRIDNKYMGVFTLPSRWYIFLFLIIGIAVCIILIMIKSKTVEYVFYKED